MKISTRRKIELLEVLKNAVEEYFDIKNFPEIYTPHWQKIRKELLILIENDKQILLDKKIK